MGVLVASAYASGLALSSLVQRQWRRAPRRIWLYIGAAIVTNLLLFLLSDGLPILHVLAFLPGCAAVASIWMLKRK
jgi:UDP-N-acetylenolpyruvoylglucosamine reductase